MDLMLWLWDFAVHLDAHLADFVTAYGAWVYALLFLIVFCETGLVVTPFLPGDSLLFVVGALAAAGGMDIAVVMLVLISAALCGDNVNYFFGRWAGPRVFQVREARWLNHRHLERSQAFYARHGGKTVVMARFVPIVRTFAPFVAGVGRMFYPRFLAFSVGGAILWVVSLCLAGYYFGNIPIVKKNLTVVIMGIIVLSVLPVALSWWNSRTARR
jgi:membrane-associated protein